MLDALRGLTMRSTRMLADDDVVTLAFGLQTPPDQPLRRWSFRVYSIAWRIQSGTRLIAGSEDEHDVLRETVSVLDGRAVQAVSLRPTTMDTTFDYGDHELRIFPVTSVADPRHWQQWSVRTPSGGYVDVGPGATWSRRGAPGERKQ